jgi:hypothetical protein
MPNRHFSYERQLAGVSKAIKSLRRKKRNSGGGPVWLLPSLERREAQLKELIAAQSRPATFLEHSFFGVKARRTGEKAAAVEAKG